MSRNRWNIQRVVVIRKKQMSSSIRITPNISTKELFLKTDSCSLLSPLLVNQTVKNPTNIMKPRLTTEIRKPRKYL